jgi:hypothetical protein
VKRSSCGPRKTVGSAAENDPHRHRWRPQHGHRISTHRPLRFHLTVAACIYGFSADVEKSCYAEPQDIRPTTLPDSKRCPRRPFGTRTVITIWFNCGPQGALERWREKLPSRETQIFESAARALWTGPVILTSCPGPPHLKWAGIPFGEPFRESPGRAFGRTFFAQLPENRCKRNLCQKLSPKGSQEVQRRESKGLAKNLRGAERTSQTGVRRPSI